ncbi:unnamed protein product [Closterium sp. NIES-53]
MAVLAAPAAAAARGRDHCAAHRCNLRSLRSGLLPWWSLLCFFLLLPPRTFPSSASVSAQPQLTHAAQAEADWWAAHARVAQAEAEADEEGFDWLLRELGGGTSAEGNEWEAEGGAEGWEEIPLEGSGFAELLTWLRVNGAGGEVLDGKTVRLRVFQMELPDDTSLDWQGRQVLLTRKEGDLSGEKAEGENVEGEERGRGEAEGEKEKEEETRDNGAEREKEDAKEREERKYRQLLAAASGMNSSHLPLRSPSPSPPHSSLPFSHLHPLFPRFFPQLQAAAPIGAGQLLLRLPLPLLLNASRCSAPSPRLPLPPRLPVSPGGALAACLLLQQQQGEGGEPGGREGGGEAGEESWGAQVVAALLASRTAQLLPMLRNDLPHLPLLHQAVKERQQYEQEYANWTASITAGSGSSSNSSPPSLPSLQQFLATVAAVRALALPMRLPPLQEGQGEQGEQQEQGGGRGRKGGKKGGRRGGKRRRKQKQRRFELTVVPLMNAVARATERHQGNVWWELTHAGFHLRASEDIPTGAALVLPLNGGLPDPLQPDPLQRDSLQVAAHAGAQGTAADLESEEDEEGEGRARLSSLGEVEEADRSVSPATLISNDDAFLSLGIIPACSSFDRVQVRSQAAQAGFERCKWVLSGAGGWEHMAAGGSASLVERLPAFEAPQKGGGEVSLFAQDHILQHLNARLPCSVLQSFLTFRLTLLSTPLLRSPRFPSPLPFPPLQLFPSLLSVIRSISMPAFPNPSLRSRFEARAAAAGRKAAEQVRAVKDHLLSAALKKGLIIRTSVDTRWGWVLPNRMQRKEIVSQGLSKRDMGKGVVEGGGEGAGENTPELSGAEENSRAGGFGDGEWDLEGMGRVLEQMLFWERRRGMRARLAERLAKRMREAVERERERGEEEDGGEGGEAGEAGERSERGGGRGSGGKDEGGMEEGEESEEGEEEGGEGLYVYADGRMDPELVAQYSAAVLLAVTGEGTTGEGSYQLQLASSRC